MPEANRGTGKLIGVILYGLVAGFATATVVALGPFALAFFGEWFFHRLAWEQASNSAAHFGFYYIFFIPLGLILGVVVCVRVWIAGSRNPSSTSSSGSK